MNMLSTLWQAQLTSMRNASRHDTRLRTAFIFILLFDIATAAWSISQLIAHITQWQALGPTAVNTGLWSICLLTWGGMSGIVILESLQQGLSDDTSLLLFTLPIPPATRFRALYGMFFLKRLWNWLLLEIGITGGALIITLGWPQALVWLALLQIGVGCVVYASMVTLMLLIRYILPPHRVKTRITILVLISIAVMLLIGWGRAGGEIQHVATPLVGVVGVGVVGRVVGVGVGRVVVGLAILLTLLLIIALGPLANLAGQLYIAAFLTIQSYDRSRKSFSIPGIKTLTHPLSQNRNLTSALLVKGLLNQTRNLMFWGRIAIILVALFFFPQAHALATSHGLPDTFFVIAYASGLALLTILEQAPNALSAEGNRLALYLTAPFKPTDILRAKLLVFLLPILVEGLAINLFLSWRLGLPISNLPFTATAIVLVLTACTALPVWGSIWDENLNLAVEGTIQMMMQEEAAITPKRLALLNLSLLLFATSLLTAWKFSTIMAIGVLILLNAIVLTTMLHLSRRHLQRLVQDT